MKSKINRIFNKLSFCSINSVVSISGVQRLPLIFVLGCPRSGTTLTYQLLINAFETGYISNRIAPFYGALGFAEKFFGSGARFSPVSYKSQHGVTEGSSGPHECGAFWYQFFPKDSHYSSLSIIDQKKINQLKKHVTLFQKSVGQPIIFKNVVNCARLQVLQSVFPDAVFIVVRRNREATVRSILKAREHVGVNAGEWWSLRPDGYESVQAVDSRGIAEAQFDLTYQIIDRDLKGRRLDVDYEALSENPHDELREIEDRLRDFGIELSRRPWTSIPLQFDER